MTAVVVNAIRILGEQRHLAVRFEVYTPDGDPRGVWDIDVPRELYALHYIRTPEAEARCKALVCAAYPHAQDLAWTAAHGGKILSGTLSPPEWQTEVEARERYTAALKAYDAAKDATDAMIGPRQVEDSA